MYSDYQSLSRHKKNIIERTERKWKESVQPTPIYQVTVTMFIFMRDSFSVPCLVQLQQVHSSNLLPQTYQINSWLVWNAEDYGNTSQVATFFLMSSFLALLFNPEDTTFCFLCFFLGTFLVHSSNSSHKPIKSTIG